MRLIDADAVLDILRNFDHEHADLENGSEDFVYGVETAIEVIENAPTMWHKVNSRKDLPEMCVPVIIEYDRGITVAILDDAWVRSTPMWYVNNEPIGLWNAVDRWMEIPR